MTVTTQVIQSPSRGAYPTDKRFAAGLLRSTSALARAFAFMICLLSLILLSGCGYQQSGSGAGSVASPTTSGSSASSPGYRWTSLYRQDIRTVAVPIFTNVDFARGDEFTLTKAVVMQIEQRTPYKVVSRDKADTIIEGQITRVKLTTVSSDRSSALPQEQLYGVRVDFVWKDLRTGKILVERRGFEQQSPFYPTLGEGRPTGAINSVEQLAIAIVQELEAQW